MTAVEIPLVVALDRSLPASARLLYGAIAQAATPEQGCRLTHQQLSEVTAIGYATVIKGIARLQAAGLIRTEKVNAVANVYWPLASGESDQQAPQPKAAA